MSVKQPTEQLIRLTTQEELKLCMQITSFQALNESLCTSYQAELLKSNLCVTFWGLGKKLV